MGLKNWYEETIVPKLVGAGCGQEEIAALQTRLAALLKTPFFPHPDPTRRQVPWPLV